MTELNKIILFQYFTGDASPVQKRAIEQWLQEGANAELFYQWLEEWEKEQLQFVPDLSLATAKIMEKIDSISADPLSAVPPIATRTPFYSKKIWWVAACVSGLLLFLFRNEIMYRHYTTGNAEVKAFMLADGSRVILNANSSMLVSRWGFDNGDRKVRLAGEAAFTVKHTLSNQKFLVMTLGPLNVEVLGTQFSVYSRNEKSRVELRKGSVKVLFNKHEYLPLILKPGDMVNMDMAGKVLLKHDLADQNFIAWKDHRFVFDSTSLPDAVRYIQDFFGDKIIIGDDALKPKRITGSFQAESSEELLSILTEIYDMEVLKRADSLVLKQKVNP